MAASCLLKRSIVLQAVLITTALAIASGHFSQPFPSIQSMTQSNLFTLRR